MTTESGQKMQSAIQAVCRMQSEVGKLLVGFDKLVPWPYESVFGNYTTRELSYSVHAKFWMPEGVYRYLRCKTDHRLVEGVCAAFIHSSLEEPILIAGHLEYQTEATSAKKAVDEWDLWYLYFKWNDGWKAGEPRSCALPDDGRIKSANVVVHPLYAITSMEDVRQMLLKVR